MGTLVLVKLLCSLSSKKYSQLLCSSLGGFRAVTVADDRLAFLLQLYHLGVPTPKGSFHLTFWIIVHLILYLM